MLCRDFLAVHPHLRFLGLALTDVCEDPMFVDQEDPDYRTDITVSDITIISSSRKKLGCLSVHLSVHFYVDLFEYY